MSRGSTSGGADLLTQASSPKWVAEWLPLWVHGLWGYEFGMAAGVELDVPSLAVHDDVVVLAQQAHIAQTSLVGTYRRWMLAVAHRACVTVDVDDYGADTEGAHGVDGDRGERLIDLA